MFGGGGVVNKTNINGNYKSVSTVTVPGVSRMDADVVCLVRIHL